MNHPDETKSGIYLILISKMGSSSHSSTIVDGFGDTLFVYVLFEIWKKKRTIHLGDEILSYQGPINVIIKVLFLILKFA